MKKFVSALLTLALSTSLLSVAASAVKDGASWGDIPLTKETITIDGKMDEIYKKGLKITPDIKTDAKATANVYYLHDGKNIYVFADVKDPEIVAFSADKEKNFWEEDGVEVSFDTKNDGTTRYKITALYDGWFAGSGAPEAADAIKKMWDVKAVKGDDGYTVEAKFTLNNGATTGSQVGCQLIINDMIGTKRNMIKKAHKLNAGDNEMQKWDYFVLSSKEVKLDKAPAASKPAAATADFTAVAALATLAAGAVVVAKKKH